MSDVYIPGVTSRFNTDQMIDAVMNVQRIPRDRVEQNIETLQRQRSYWQILGSRINSLRQSASNLFAFQNPFNERIARSADDSVITASATRQASEQSFSFTVTQTAAADRFISRPLDERMRIEAGTYIFTVGDTEIPITFRGGTLREFVDIVNSRGRDKISANLIAVQAGTRSLLIESRETGAENRLGFAGDSIELVTSIGMMERSNDSQRDIAINNNTIQRSGQNASDISVSNGALQVSPQSTASVPINMSMAIGSPLVLRLETQTRISYDDESNNQPPPGPSIQSGSVTYSGITITNEPSNAPMPQWQPPPAPVRHDNMSVLTLVFSDGTREVLPAISDSNSPTTRQYNVGEIAQGRTLVSLNVENENTHREVSIGNIEIFDPSSVGGLRPVNAVSTARDSIISMEGIQITRPTNNIDDLIPGVTINVRGVSTRPVELSVRADTESIKDAIISFVGNYNLLMAELNVLTRRATLSDGRTSITDYTIIEELTYLTADEAAAMRERQGAFASDSTLSTLRNNLMRTISAPYPTFMERELSLLAQIGISTNALGGSGYDPSRLRGYLQINEGVLDRALETNVLGIKELFANDTTGDLLADTGVAFNIDALASPYVGIGGIISLKTSTIDSRIGQDQTRITTLDRQLAAKEAELRLQYARMEQAYAQMERMSSSLENFNIQNRGN